MMNGKGAVLETEKISFSTNITENKTTETRHFEEVRIESVTVSEIKTKDSGTRFARLKRALRKRSASIL
jgi:hypothetical protein